LIKKVTRCFRTFHFALHFFVRRYT
jgi:hypothetical protein